MTNNASPLWHPFTQHGILPPILHAQKAEGAYIYTKDGRKIIDAIGSWWVNIHGHCHPKIVEAVRAQAGQLDQVIFASFTHDPAQELAEKMIALTQPHFSKVFLSDSGSTANEVALKMSIGHWHRRGTPKHKVLALDGGYHGDTFGGMAVGARSPFCAGYESFLFDVHHLPFPVDDGANTITALKNYITKNKNDIAAFIVEPLIQGAGGIRIYSQAVLKNLMDLCRAENIHIIFDEVMTGFGRTGKRFAYEYFTDAGGSAPDLVCLSKGLTSGFLPMGMTLATEDIYQSYFSKDRARTFFHSTSFSGNPMACAAANAALDLWDVEKVPDNINRISHFHETALQKFKNHKKIANPRHMGVVAALDFVGAEEGYLAEVASHLYRYFLDKNVLLRPLGNVVYILPPYCMSNEDLEIVYATIAQALEI